MRNKSLGLLGILCALLVCIKVFTGEKPSQTKKFSPRYAEVNHKLGDK